MTYKRRRATKAIVIALRSVGGVASRTQLRKIIADDEHSGFTYNDVYGQITSRNGNQYIPFNLDFGFGVRELVALNFIEPVHGGGSLVLTELGRTVDLSHFPNDEQEAQMSAYWAEKNKLRTKKKTQVKLKAKSVTPVEESADDESESVDDDDLTGWRVQLLQQLKQFSSAKFESFARMLVSQMGVTIDKNLGIVQSGDHGIDGYGYFESNEFRTIRVAIQAKRYTDNAVSEPEVDKFKGVMDGFNAEYGIFITTTYFTPKAKAKAVQGNRTVTLIDGQRIADLVAQYQLYVKPVQSFILDDYYFEQN